MLVMAWPAAAHAGSPPSVHPTSTVTSAKVKGNTVHFVVAVTFALPAHTPAASACKGKVEVSKAVKGHQKAPHWTGPLSPHGALCRAIVHGQLPAGLFNRKVPFTISFDGNGAVAPFSKAASLKLSPPGGSGKVAGPPATPACSGPGHRANRGFVLHRGGRSLERPVDGRWGLHQLHGRRRRHPNPLQLDREHDP